MALLRGLRAAYLKPLARFSLASTATTATIRDVELKERDLRLHWRDSDRRPSDVLYLFLRDNCTEPESFDKSSRQRLFNPAFDVDLNLTAKEAIVSPDGKKVTITWSDDHRSNYTASWLAERCDGETDCTARLTTKELWTAQTKSAAARLPAFDYATIRDDSTKLLDMLLGLETHGLAIVRNCGESDNFVEEFANVAVGYPFTTTYGNKRSFVAHGTRDGTGLRTHLPSYQYVPPISGIHCIARENVTGGTYLFSDGFRAAELLRKRNPEAFRLLSEMPIYFKDDPGPEFRHATETWHPTIIVDEDGYILQVCVNDGMRTPHVAVDFQDQLCDWYDAYYEFMDIVEDTQFVLRHDFEPGQLIVKDNFRILDGVERVEIAGEGKSHMNVVYVGWDEARSRARVLKTKLFGDED